MTDEHEPNDEGRWRPVDAPPPPAAQPVAADEQLTVPEDREASAAAERRKDSPPASPAPYEVIGDQDRADLRRRWDALQAGFVDDPKAAAEQADALVAELVDRLRRRYEEVHDEFGERFDAGADTENMRQAVRRYRAFYVLLAGP